MAGTYQSPQKKYYWKNREKIHEKTKEYKKEYNRLYYLAHKEELLAKRAKSKKFERKVLAERKAKKKRRRNFKNIILSNSL